MSSATVRPAPATSVALSTPHAVVPAEPRELNIEIQLDWIQAALTRELGRKSLLDDFQVVTSKFTEGRVALTDFQIAAVTGTGTARVTAFGHLRFKRRQLGIKWRGLKSHKKWFEKGEKHVATVRVSGIVSLAALPDPSGLKVHLNDLRAKITGHLRPARGVVVRFDVKDRTFDWTPKDRTWIQRILTYAFELRGARISRVTASTVEISLRGVTPSAFHSEPEE